MSVKQRTNAEKIRSMKDEGLAEFLMRVTTCDNCPVCCEELSKNCKKEIVKWLHNDVGVWLNSLDET